MLNLDKLKNKKVKTWFGKEDIISAVKENSDGRIIAYCNSGIVCNILVLKNEDNSDINFDELSQKEITS